MSSHLYITRPAKDFVERCCTKVQVEKLHDDLEASLYQSIINDKVCLSVMEVKVMITKFKWDLLATERLVEEELPLNRWLYEYIYRSIDPSVFITEYREENIKSEGFPGVKVTEINEYALF